MFIDACVLHKIITCRQTQPYLFSCVVEAFHVIIAAHLFRHDMYHHISKVEHFPTPTASSVPSGSKSQSHAGGVDISSQVMAILTMRAFAPAADGNYAKKTITSMKGQFAGSSSYCPKMLIHQ